MDDKKSVDSKKTTEQKVVLTQKKENKYVFIASGRLTKPNGEVLVFKAGDDASKFSQVNIKHYLSNGIIKEQK